ncbi:MAG: hypothetical protein IJR00_01360 [Lachnospiraceae bacterium]|nr:hypothetical protein [Lachnospiraceae bacterium]
MDIVSKNKIPIVPLLGYTQAEKEAAEYSQREIIKSGYKFAVLGFDGSFYLTMHNLTKQEQKGVIERVTKEYCFAVSEG